MKKTAKMLVLEQSRGRDIKTILKESYTKYGLNKSAIDLGVTSQTLVRWWTLFKLKGLTQRTLEEEK